MSVTDFLTLKAKNDPLVTAPLNSLVLLHKWSSGAAYIPTSITDSTGALQALPGGATGWRTAGELQKKAGLDMTPNQKNTDIEGLGSAAPRRTIATSQGLDLDFTAQEWRKVNMEMFYGTDLSAITADPVSGEWRGHKSASLTQQYWSAIVLAFDGIPGSEVYPFWIYPKLAVTKTGKISLQDGSEIAFPSTLTVYNDTAFISSDGVKAPLYDFGVAGIGNLALAPSAGFTVPVNEVQTVTVGGSPTGGTFTLTFAGQTTATITYNAAASAVQTALQALSTIGSGNITVSGSGGGPYTCTFAGTLAGMNVAQMTASAAGLTPSGTVTVVTTTPGSP